MRQLPSIALPATGCICKPAALGHNRTGRHIAGCCAGMPYACCRSSHTAHAAARTAAALSPARVAAKLTQGKQPGMPHHATDTSAHAHKPARLLHLAGCGLTQVSLQVSPPRALTLVRQLTLVWQGRSCRHCKSSNLSSSPHSQLHHPQPLQHHYTKRLHVLATSQLHIRKTSIRGGLPRHERSWRASGRLRGKAACCVGSRRPSDQARLHVARRRCCILLLLGNGRRRAAMVKRCSRAAAVWRCRCAIGSCCRQGRGCISSRVGRKGHARLEAGALAVCAVPALS